MPMVYLQKYWQQHQKHKKKSLPFETRLLTIVYNAVWCIKNPGSSVVSGFLIFLTPVMQPV
jgi:hypothetical protein